jgi:CheY-like chemotaxis protein
MAPASNSTRILVVDDEPLVADTLGIILQRTGFEVRVTYDGLDAIAAARSFRPDIVLAEYSMPNMNGMDACIEIKRILPACRIIMLSGQSLSEEFEPYRSRGYDFAILSKPIHPSDLLATIEAERLEPNDSRERLMLNVDDVE